MQSLNRIKPNSVLSHSNQERQSHYKQRGANLPASKPLNPVRRINQQGLELLRQFERLPVYAEQSLREIEQAVLQQVTVPLTANQFSALVCLTYSLGEANLRRSLLLKYLNTGRYQAAADEFERWVYVGANRLPKLVARRRAEKQLFLQS